MISKLLKKTVTTIHSRTCDSASKYCHVIFTQSRRCKVDGSYHCDAGRGNSDNGCERSPDLKRNTQFKEIPSPKHFPLFGTVISLILAGGAPKLHVYADNRHKQLGPIFKERLGNVEAVFISNPDYMRAVFAQEGKHPIHVLPEAWALYNEIYGCSRGLFFMNGDEWLHYRRIMNNFLLKSNLNYLEKACETASMGLARNLEESTIDLETKLYRWSVDTIVAVLLGDEIYKQNKHGFDTKLDVISKTVHLIFETTAKLQFIPANLAAKWKIAAWKNFVKSVDGALQETNNLVKDLYDNFPNCTGLLGMMINEKMPKADIIKIVVDLVLAAGDTTAYTMQWILYLLAKNRKIQEDIHDELKIPSIALTRNFIKETLRLYPVAPFLTRILPDDAIIGPHLIPKNTLVLYSLYTSGRDEMYFEEPNVFKPERWVGRNPIMAQASLPFAMGSRSCIGKKIAEYQLQTALTHLIKDFTVEMHPDANIDIVLKMVAVPDQPINLKLTKRCSK